MLFLNFFNGQHTCTTRASSFYCDIWRCLFTVNHFVSSYAHCSLMSQISWLFNMQSIYCPNTKRHAWDSYLLKLNPLKDNSFFSMSYHYAYIVFFSYIFLHMRNVNKFHWFVFQEPFFTTDESWALRVTWLRSKFQ